MLLFFFLKLSGRYANSENTILSAETVDYNRILYPRNSISITFNLFDLLLRCLYEMKIVPAGILYCLLQEHLVNSLHKITHSHSTSFMRAFSKKKKRTYVPEIFRLFNYRELSFNYLLGFFYKTLKIFLSRYVCYALRLPEAGTY